MLAARKDTAHHGAHHHGAHRAGQRAVRRYGVGNVTARCGDGCLDRLVVSVRRSVGHPVPVRNGAIVLSLQAQAPLLLLGLLSGSAPRREVLRCTWMRVPIIRDNVRVLFIVGKANAEKSSDVLAVDVVEGAFMRSKADEKRNTSRTFDVKKAVRTGSITTYWKLVEWLKYAATQPEPMVGRADDDVFISPRMLVAHATLLLSHASPPRSPLVYAGVFEWSAHTKACCVTSMQAQWPVPMRSVWHACTLANANAQCVAADACAGTLGGQGR